MVNNVEAPVKLEANPPVSPLVTMPRTELLNIALIGVGTGIVTWLLYHVLNTYLFTAVLCKGVATSDCARSPEYALIVATILSAMFGLFGLVRIRAFRPPLVVAGATVCLWGFGSVFFGAVWFWPLVIIPIIYGLAYALFAWLVRPRSFILAVTLVIVAVVLGRLVLSLAA
jgi:hypothetical protein